MNGGSLSSLRTLSSRAIAKTRPINYLKNVDLYQHVLPWVTKETCLQFLKQKGPSFWKMLDTVSDYKQHESTQLLILTEQGLSMQLRVYFHLWNQDVQHLPMHIYQLGWGHCLKQCIETSHLRFLQCLDPTDVGSDPLLMSPILMHENDYFPFNMDYSMAAHAVNCGPEFDLTGKTHQDVYYLNLFNAESCIKRDRWSESFAYALSALDYRREATFHHLHHLFCQLALSAGKMSLHFDVWINLLYNAQKTDLYIHDKWRRIVVFHRLLTHHGLFDLEKMVFSYGFNHISSGSTIHSQLLMQHLYALMAQVENMMGFQFLRQTFHESCDKRTCGKPVYAQYSFVYASTLLREMEKIVQLLPNQTVRHYFQGYVHLYKSFGSVLNVPTENDKMYLEMAKASFELASLESEGIGASNAMWKDLEFMRAIVKNVPIDISTIEDAYSMLTNMRYNNEAANTCFRILLLFFYWGIGLDASPPVSFAEAAYRVYKQTTAYSGYRIGLLEACHKYLNFGMLAHGEQEMDYPSVDCMSSCNQDLNSSVEAYWKTEMEQLASGTCATTQQLLYNSTECQELYAFGKQIITHLIEN